MRTLRFQIRDFETSHFFCGTCIISDLKANHQKTLNLSAAIFFSSFQVTHFINIFKVCIDFQQLTTKHCPIESA